MKCVVPSYLKQSDMELVQKFRFIQHREDERLREATMDDKHSRWSLGASFLEQNDDRNRYVNIMPYERNRVKLDVVSGNDYINASYVKLDVPGQSVVPGHYIATQGPTKKTWPQFWQMCYQKCPKENIVVVMVTPLKEANRAKCYPYWPMGKKPDDAVKIVPKSQYPGGASDESSFLDELHVEYHDHVRVDDLYTMTTLKLVPQHGTGPTKTVHHFYFDQWRDMSKPEEVVPIMKLCRHSHSCNSDGNPIVVHCSAGVGRSGTFIALDHLIHDTADFTPHSPAGQGYQTLVPVQDYRHDLIEQIVSQLRSQRMKMVQMVDQYTFIYHAARYLYELSQKKRLA
ncbi:hypothetical protein HG536_0D00570 [Torulaspora globosa]|uniref:protein-tyrosine-phosphatase n=1 Tax=Torulaspora globosa TaxID=48254 RepID=A0A7G3ZG99_9SACH|nr:uncharacterized protein HG536_0D00570 [Torulaspora globosa]QLL32535.1 hypothetical protein HG536_0D00570 [Torulaspora globosa]